MFACALQDHTSSVASEGRCLGPPYCAWGVLLEVFLLLEKQHVVRLVAVTTPYLRAWVRRSGIILELTVIVTVVIINSRLRRRRDWRDWEMLNCFRGDVLALLTYPHTFLPSARLTIATALRKGICRIARRLCSVYPRDNENAIAPIVPGAGLVALGGVPS